MNIFPYCDADISYMKSQVAQYSGVFVGIGGAALISAIFMFGCFGFMGNKLALRIRMLLFRSMLHQVCCKSQK